MEDPSLGGFVDRLIESREVLLAFGSLDQLLYLFFYLFVFRGSLAALP